MILQHLKKNNNYICTFVSDKINNNILFGFSVYNKQKESDNFNKKIGLKIAVEAMKYNIEIDTKSKCISKDSIIIHDKFIIDNAIKFIYRTKSYYHNKPTNVTVIFDIDYLSNKFSNTVKYNNFLRQNNKELTNSNKILTDRLTEFVKFDNNFKNNYYYNETIIKKYK